MWEVISLKVQNDKRIGNEAEFLEHKTLYFSFGESFEDNAYFFGS